jgi:hypothetical protein
MSGDPTPQSGSQSPSATSQSPAEIAQRQQYAMIQAAFHGSVPRYYTNLIAPMLTPSDICLVLLTNGAPSATVILSYPTAKQLSGELQELMKKLEEVMGQRIKPLAEMQGDINKIGAN